LRGNIIERLMCDMAVNLDAIAGEFNFDVATDFSDELESLQPFQENGSVLIDDHRIRITEQGRPYMRLVASVFDTYLARANSRHSVAV
jgi:Coproporphyrinogen III oxidase and related Fe-S oxidoreductases